MFNRKFKYIFIPAFILAVILTCKKNDNDKQNSFTVNETEFLTPDGYLEIYSPKQDGGDFDIILTDGEYLADSSYYYNWNTFVYFDFKSPSTTELSPGQYVFDTNWPPNSFAHGTIAMYGSQGVSFEVTDGTVLIEKTGESYQISYDITIGSSTQLTGYYKGSLTVVDQTQ
jgi:hypothetical protein